MHVSKARAPGLAITLAHLCSCGAGTAAIVAGAGGGGGGNSAPAIANLQVPVSKTSPARIQFELSDREGETVAVQLCARVPLPGGGLSEPHVLTEVEGPTFPQNGASVAVPPGNQVKVIQADWRFPDEDFLPDDARFVEGIQLVARLSSGSELVLGDDEPLSVGNDAPVVTDVRPIVPAEGEVAGIARVEVTVEDSSDDVVTVTAEYDVQGDDPDLGWQPAVGFGLSEVRVSRDGTTLDFFWDTDAELDPQPDLHDLERGVRLRFTATDFAAVGLSRESEGFRVDNNQEPIVQVLNDSVITNRDERRGIPIPFRVVDEEGDLVDVIFQWRRPGEEFPELPEAEIDTILADPLQRREKRVCTEYPRFVRGRVVPVDGDSLQLPELATSESWFVALGVEGRVLELLRPSSSLEPITPSWSQNPLAGPVAALPLGGGLSALVLDSPSKDSWRLREIVIATGAVLPDESASLASGAGTPSALAFERAPGAVEPAAVLVAADLSGVWRIERVELASGATSELAVSDGGQPGPVRGIASLGPNRVVFTAGSALLSLDYQDLFAPLVVTLLDGLATPWGVVADSLAEDRVYLAERDFVRADGTGRILAIELDSLAKLPVVVNAGNLEGFEHPQALALEDKGTRLLVVAETTAGATQLVGIGLGARGRNLAFPIGPPRSSDIATLTGGPHGQRLATVPQDSVLLAGGGIEQRHAIVQYEPSAQRATVERSFEPALRPGQEWRVSAEVRRRPASDAGGDRMFVWDTSSDVPEGGSVFLRALPRDEEIGITVDTRLPKRVRAALDVEPLVLGGPGTTDTAASVAAADLDSDGDLDLVSANVDNQNLTVFFQTSPGRFDPIPRTVGGPGINGIPASVAAADLDSDGDSDLVCGNGWDSSLGLGSNLTLFFQSAPGEFAGPLVLGDYETTIDPRSVAAADLDSDGDVDIVSANQAGDSGDDNLTVFFQTAPGSFDPVPLVLEGTAGGHPSSVATADLDQDGDIDIVSANGFSNDLWVFFQRSPGRFRRTPLVLSADFPAFVATADGDADGDVDIVSSSLANGTLTVFFQSSPGAFSSKVIEGTGGLGSNPVSLADMDQDGDIDLVYLIGFGLELWVYFQSAPGSFELDPLELQLPPATLPASLTAADIDADGDVDIATGNLNSLTVSFQSSPGSFETAPLTDFFPINVVVADLDQDGDHDLATTRNELELYFQTAPGHFDPTPLVLDAPAPNHYIAMAADFDSDGDVDLSSFDNTSSTLIFHRQSAPREYETVPQTLGAYAWGSVPADLDSDGDLDLVAADHPADQLVLLLQDAPWSFSRGPFTLGGPEITDGLLSIVAADLDDDGDLDLVSSNYGNSNVTAFFQTATGPLTFDPSPRALGGPGITDDPRSVAADDLDRDGDLELVTTNFAGGDLTVFFQSEPGTFDQSPLVLGPVPRYPHSVEPVDLDSDGDIDLTFVSDSGLQAFIQSAPGAFDPTPLALAGPELSPYPIVATDLDGDGEVDVLPGSMFGRMIVLWGGR